MNVRSKRLRYTNKMRNMVKDTYLDIDDLVYPIFVVEGDNIYEEITSMPGQFRYSIDKLSLILDELLKYKVNKLLLFGIPLIKDEMGSQAYNDKGIIQETIRFIKKNYPSFYLISDVCFCEYTSHGHCGILDDHLIINNDLSNKYLAKIALSHAKAGVDMVAPSDKQDFSITSIRNILDINNFSYLPIMAYSSKFASSFYGPFRLAANSGFQHGNRNYYQLDYRNKKAALLQSDIELNEGADLLMVKPASHYLDIIYQLSESYNVPVACYQVSGEYAMIKFAAMHDALNEKECMMESMYAFKRAGASIIITYFALEVAKYLSYE